MYKFFKDSAIFIFQATAIYVAWITLHFVAVHLYHNYCSPTTIMGYLLSPLMTVAPHCKALRWLITTGGNVIETMWVVLGIWLISKIIIPK